MANFDYRAKLQALGTTDQGKELVYGKRGDKENLLYPLWETDGVMFPYTPMIQVQHANVGYGQYELPHTNYDYLAYAKTQSPSMTVTGMFGAHTYAEARYMMACLHFFRVVTKSNFGIKDAEKDIAGTPPPKLAFSAYGPAMFSRTPVYIRSVAFGLDQDVDYVPCGPDKSKERAQRQAEYMNTSNTDIPLEPVSNSGLSIEEMLEKSYVPLILNIFVELVVTPTPSAMRDQFSLEEFRSGKLLEKGFY